MSETGCKVYVDLADGLSRVCNNKKLYARVLGLFLQGAEFEKFNDALAEGDYSKAAALAHAIKGMTGNLGLKAVFEGSGSLMRQLRAGALDEALLVAFRADMAETKRQVESLLSALQA